MSYYDDDDEDDEYLAEEDLFYHNYSVAYANQVLRGQHDIPSSLPRQRRKTLRKRRMTRVSTWNQMPIETRHRLPSSSSRSRPKYDHHHREISSAAISPPSRLPTLVATREELERRATRGVDPQLQERSVEILPSFTEAQLRQVQQQQEAFQEHLRNIQRHLNEQSQQQLPQRASSWTSGKRREPSPCHLDYDDDQAEIAERIEKDPYFAAAMEDFVHSHGLMHRDRHRIHSGHSSSSTTSNAEMLLLRELREIRHLMKKYLEDRDHRPPRGPVRYPTVQPDLDRPPATVPPHRTLPPPPRPPAYENLVTTVKDAIQGRRPSQEDQPLLPSQIDRKFTRPVRRPPPIPLKEEPSPRSPTTTINPPAAPPLPPSVAPINPIPVAPPYEAFSTFSLPSRSPSYDRESSD